MNNASSNLHFPSGSCWNVGFSPLHHGRFVLPLLEPFSEGPFEIDYLFRDPPRVQDFSVSTCLQMSVCSIYANCIYSFSMCVFLLLFFFCGNQPVNQSESLFVVQFTLFQRVKVESENAVKLHCTIR